MSEKSSRKEKYVKRSSSSSSYSSSDGSSDSSSSSSGNEKHKDNSKANALVSSSLVVNMNKAKLDLGYKIQQEESEDCMVFEQDSSILPRGRSRSKEPSKDGNKLSRDRSRSKLRDCSRSVERQKEMSRSKESRSYQAKSKDLLKEYSIKKGSKRDRSGSSEKRFHPLSKEKKKKRSRSREMREEHFKSKERKPMRSRSKDMRDSPPSKEKKRERSKSRDKKRERSHSIDKKRDGSQSRDKKKERSCSKDKKRDRSRSRDRRKERSRSKEKKGEKFRRDSRSPSYYKEGSSKTSYGHFKRGHSSKRNSRTRSRSRSRSHKRSRSRSRSYDRPKRGFDKKFNKLSILEKLGIELKVPEGQQLGAAGTTVGGFTIPSYYNPTGVNPLKYAQQMQKRRLIWGNKKQEVEAGVEKKEEEKPTSTKTEPAGPESVWKGTTFSQDQDGKLTAKFKRLMGIKDAGDGSSESSSDLIQKQEEMFSSMEKQYEVARVSTHTHRGLGLGFGVHLPR